MTLLDSHLEQIALSAKTIGDLDFPPPKIFTNALLGHHEITTLIRDTEPHERALFSIDPDATDGLNSRGARRTTIFRGDTQSQRKTIQPAQQRQSSAVAKVLGSAMLRQIQQSSHRNGKRTVNVEVLLQGAEKLCAIYPVVGADQRMSALRARHSRIAESVSEYESKIMRQQARLNRTNTGYQAEDQMDTEEAEVLPTPTSRAFVMTEDDLRAEQDEVKALEAKKKMLEERIAGMERDLGGLLR